MGAPTLARHNRAPPRPPPMIRTWTALLVGLAACGGKVCDWNKGMTCQPAGGAPEGQDGWCMKDDDCKCKGEGATCVGVSKRSRLAYARARDWQRPPSSW